ncbi:MAG: hypothetical protein KC419_01020 [Anaerolineales bacterium]|nr:hypothetical protein [Anaerolineales bacterium]
MSANAELNKTLLNAMFALNEAGDNLDEIYRIGLETAVSLLNADRGCIFRRDDWDDDKWTIAQIHQIDQKQAEIITAAQLLSQAVENEGFPISSELFNLYQDNGIATPDAIYCFPLKMHQWPKWCMQIERNSLTQLDEKKLQVVQQFCHQVEKFLQKICQFEDAKNFLIPAIYSTRAPVSIVIGSMQLMLLDNDPLTNQQQQYVEATDNAAKLIERAIQTATYVSQLFNKQHLIRSQKLYKKINELPSQTITNLLIDEFTLHVNEFFFFHLLEAVLKKSAQSHIEIRKKSANPKLIINCFYEDSSLTIENASNFYVLHHSSILHADDAPLSLMKTFINYNGGQFKISAEAGKGYTLIITFPIVTEDTHE